MYKNLFLNKQAAFFDLDGTIVDTVPLWKVSVERVLKNFLNFEETFNLMHGASIYTNMGYLIKEHNLETKQSVNELADLVINEFINILQESDLEPRDGFWDFTYELKKQKNLKLALTTNTKKSVAQAVLNKLGISETFDLYVFGDEVSKEKPDPEIYLKTSKTLNVSPRQCIVFEDSIIGCKAALNAGMDVAVIWDGTEEKHEYPDDDKLIEFYPNFSVFVGNLDMDFKEFFNKSVERFKNSPEYQAGTSTGTSASTK